MNDTKKLSEINAEKTHDTQRLDAPAQTATKAPDAPKIVAAKAAPAQKAPQKAVPVKTESKRSVWPRVFAWSAGVAGVLLLSGLAGGYVTYDRWQKSEVIAPNIFIHGEPVGGLTHAQATQNLQKRFGRLFVSIKTPKRPYRLALRQLGGEPQIKKVVDEAYSYGRSGALPANLQQLAHAQKNEERLSLPMRWDKAQLKKTMWTVAGNYHQSAHNARLEVGERGVKVIAHREGRNLNVGETLQTLQKKYYVGIGKIDSTTRAVMPRITSASLVGRDVLLGKYKTYFDSDVWGRTRNIRVAASEIDGKVLMPGEKFSFNEITGERTYKKGYRMAHIFQRQPGEAKSQVVDGLAGGVCQVSSTLFNAVRRTNRKTDARLRILERNYHSLPVTYVPAGLDATVAWPDRDFKFRNNFVHPIYIRAKIDGSHLVIGIWGRVPTNVGAVTVADVTAANTSTVANAPSAETGAAPESARAS